MSSLKISIAIPTYNRIESLKKQVNYFCDEGIFNNEVVELIISDNCSNDGTDTYLDTIHEAYPNIVINKNKENKGLIGNIISVCQIAKGDYLWIVGDDDIIKKGAVRKITDCLDLYKNLYWVFLKYEEYDGINTTTQCLKCDDYYENGIDLFRAIVESNYKLGAPMFITASIYKLAVVKKVLNIYCDSNEYLVNNLAFPLGLSYSCSLEGAAAVIMGELVTDDIAGIGWSDSKIKVFCRDQIAILDLVSRHYNVKLSDQFDLLKSLVSQCPEWRYFKSKDRADNYAMKYYLKTMPLQIIIDLMDILITRVLRGTNK